MSHRRTALRLTNIDEFVLLRDKDLRTRQRMPLLHAVHTLSYTFNRSGQHSYVHDYPDQQPAADQHLIVVSRMLTHPHANASQLKRSLSSAGLKTPHGSAMREDLEPARFKLHMHMTRTDQTRKNSKSTYCSLASKSNRQLTSRAR